MKDNSFNMEEEKVYKPVIVRLNMTSESARKLLNIINRIKSYGYTIQVPVQIIERAIAEEIGYSSSTISIFKRHLLNFGLLNKTENKKIFGINKIVEDL